MITVKKNLELKKFMSKIVFTGGGTGGHVFPIIAVAREIEKKVPEENKLLLPRSQRRFSHVFCRRRGSKQFLF